MITGIEFHKLNENKIVEMLQLTKNTIVLFNNSDLKFKFINEFLKIRNELDDSVMYNNDKNKKSEISFFVNYKPTSIYKIDDEQTFIFTVEAPFILQAKDPYDIWFCDIKNGDEVELYSFIDFEGYEEVWNKGIERLYQNFINGRYGCYEGYGK